MNEWVEFVVLSIPEEVADHYSVSLPMSNKAAEQYAMHLREEGVSAIVVPFSGQMPGQYPIQRLPPMDLSHRAR